MAIVVTLDDMLHDRRMTLTELAERVGITLANRPIYSFQALRRFKEDLGVLLVSGVFILLSASLDLEVLRRFEWRFGLFLLALLLLVRPATVLISLAFSRIPWRERLFVAWIAPRGIVAVAVSKLFLP